MPWWLHVLLFFLTAGMYLVVYIPYLILRSFPGWLHVLLLLLTVGLYLVVYIPYLILYLLFDGNRQKQQPRSKKPLTAKRPIQNHSLPNGATGGSIYLIHAVDTNLYKIGRTDNMKRRWGQLNSTQGPHRLKLIMWEKVRDSHFSERELHRAYSKWRRNGEWFYLDNKRLQQVKKSIKRQS